MLTPTRPALDIGLVTGNGPAMRAFYQDVLGLTPDGEVSIPGTGRIARFRCGDSRIRIFAVDRLAPGARVTGGYLDAPGLRYFTVTIANLEAVVLACRAQAVPIVTDIVSPRPGVKAAMIADPDGNTIELMEVN